MFKYFISNDTRIIITSGGKRLSFPLHTGMINVAYNYNFHLHYPRYNFDKMKKFSEKVFEKGINVNYNTQLYRIYGKNMNISIPYIFHKNIQIPENSLVSVCWEDQSDLLNNIKVISSEHAQEVIDEELLRF
jgi:hypothetical protein